MARTGRDNDFIARSRILARWRSPRWGASREALVMFALKLDGRVVVVEDRRRGTTFASKASSKRQDRSFAEHSVGSIAQLECLKWCQARGLAYDFRIGDEDYKRMWATNDRPATTYQLAIKPSGRQLLRLSAAHENARIAKDGVRTSIPSEFRRKVKQKMEEWLSRARALPARRNRSSDKESLPIRNLEHVPIGKPLRTFPGHALAERKPLPKARHHDDRRRVKDERADHLRAGFLSVFSSFCGRAAAGLPRSGRRNRLATECRSTGRSRRRWADAESARRTCAEAISCRRRRAWPS